MKTGYIYPFYIPTTLLFNGSKIIGVLMTIYQTLKNVDQEFQVSNKLQNEKSQRQLSRIPPSNVWGEVWSLGSPQEAVPCLLVILREDWDGRLILSPRCSSMVTRRHPLLESEWKIGKTFTLFGYFESWINITNTNNEKPIVILCCHLANNDNVSESIDCVSRDIMVVVVCK